ncbi:MAG: 3,4-dihydroxy-2-butanone-4-phosphate synthase [Gammaproteobacteria bacterium]|nr:3,4-dihydroxy-2-butanone-4-phosphate synthase [Gammaproteobacteria bacterium]
MKLNTVEEIIADIRQGKMVVLMDDEDRENEGDLVMAAQCVRPEDINFMARYARGLICLTLTRERCEQLRLPLMVADTNAKHATNFTVSIEAAQGVTTGISAADRATTVQAAVNPSAKPEDIVQPGHIFPLMAQQGGVLTRAGHTEAGCDLARLAGFEPASVIIEILNDDGSMARRPQLEVFAREHGLKLGTVADLIQYRLRHERTVERVAECNLATEYGEFHLYAYQDYVDQGLHLALVKGRVEGEAPVTVRVHLTDTMSDLIGAQRGDCGMPLKVAMEHITNEDNAVVVLLRRQEKPDELVRRIRDYQLQDRGVTLPRPPQVVDLRSYGVGARILADLGVRRMRVVGAPRKLHGLPGFGLEVVEYIQDS